MLITFNESHKFAYIYKISCICYSVSGSCLSLFEPSDGHTDRNKFMIKEIKKNALQLFLALILFVWHWSKTKRKQTLWDVFLRFSRTAEFLGTWTVSSDPLETEAGDKADHENSCYLAFWRKIIIVVKTHSSNFFLFSCPNYWWIISDVFKKKKKTKQKPKLTPPLLFRLSVHSHKV